MENRSRSSAIIAIGRNVGERLHRCLVSALSQSNVVVYVDSGSSDNSIQIACDLCVQVVHLDPGSFFTAAVARNAGLNYLNSLEESVEFVQFVDGDCELFPDWCKNAMEFLVQNPDVAGVCGRRREQFPHQNWYHEVVDMEWDTPIGETKSCGGDVMFRTAALRQVVGFRESLIAGEEPELCVRIRAAGWKLWRIDDDMTWHDIQMTSFSQWWKRSARSGYAYAEGARLHGAPPERHCTKELRSIWFWGIVVPIVGVVLAWPTRGISLVAMVALYVLLYLKVLRHRFNSRGESIDRASKYALSCVVSKWPQAIGVIRTIVNRLTGTTDKLIEYHQPRIISNDFSRS